MSSQFLTKDNFAKLYSNTKDIINSNENFNIDSDKKYKKALKKMAISFHEKNPNQSNLDTMNNDALNKFIPFIQSIIAKSGNKDGGIMPFDLSGDMGLGTGMGLDSGSGIMSSNLDQSFNHTYSSSINQTVSKNQTVSQNQTPTQNQTQVQNETIESDDFMRRLNMMENERNNILQKDFGAKTPSPLSLKSQTVPLNESDTQTNDSKVRKSDYLEEREKQMQEFQKQMASKEKETPKISYGQPNQPNISSNPSVNTDNTTNTTNVNIPNNNTPNLEPINIIFDTGVSSAPKVNNINKKYWISFVVPFQNPINIPGNRSLYLENLIIYGIDTPLNIPYFFIEIEEFKADTITNDFKPVKGISVFNNSANNLLVNNNQNRKLINVSNLTLSQLTVNIHTNTEDKESIFESSNMTNRIIMEFKVV